jgi:putative transposase
VLIFKNKHCIFRRLLSLNDPFLGQAVNRLDKGRSRVIGERIINKERKREFELGRSDRFRYRTRYFTDSGVIGSKEFVSSNYQRFKDLFMSKREKITKPIPGLDGVYSLKRLVE